MKPASEAVSIREGQALCDLLIGPYNAHLAALATLEDRSAVVAALEPSRLAGLLRDGVTLSLDAYGARLSSQTKALIAGWLHQHVQLVEPLGVSWSALSPGAATEVARSFRAGFSSLEAQAGTALGSLFGGLGGLAGGLVGTFVALHRDDQAFSGQVHRHLGEVDRWLTTAAADFDARLLPRVERDLNPWPYRARWAIAAALALVGLGGAAWLAQ
ncbi:MAG: hypothetical protein K0R38_5351 [Polyangiaceae bacterium]|nr:hypothetical protein [Polyangiaceae bacterium]